MKPAALSLASLLFAQPCVADPLHKFGVDGAWRHEDSGWVFPKQVGGFDRTAPPYTIDGNDDVGAEYTTMVDGVRRIARVHVYHAESAAVPAQNGVPYFFKTPKWIVTISATEPVPALDELVRALPWDTLGTDAGNLHGSGS